VAALARLDEPECRLPSAALRCLLDCVRAVYREQAAAQPGREMAAEDLLPVLIWVVATCARPAAGGGRPRVSSIAARLRLAEELARGGASGEAAYYLGSLTMGAHFLATVRALRGG
jgi:hypothetical protein